MKKLFYVLMILLISLLAACSGNEAADDTELNEESTGQKQETAKKDEKAKEEKQEQVEKDEGEESLAADKEEKKSAENKKEEKSEGNGVSVDKGRVNVEITIPASLFEGKDVDAVIAGAKKDGIKEAVKNEDGSVTYIMSKAQHKKMMDDMGKSITEYTEKLKSSEEFASIKDVTHNKNYSAFTLIVDKVAFENSIDGLAVLGLGIQGSLYQVFNGENPDSYQVKVSVKDEATKEVIREVVYPDSLKQKEEEAK